MAKFGKTLDALTRQPTSYFWGFISLMVRAGQEFLTDNCTQLAAAISYYALFSLFPLILALLSILGFILKSPQAEAQVIDGIGTVLPVSGEFIASAVRGVITARAATGAVASIWLIWGSMAMFSTIRKSVNAAWGIRTPRPFFWERLVELGMMVGGGSLLLISLALTTAIKVARSFSLPLFGVITINSEFLWQSITISLATAFAFVTFLCLYRFVPNTRVRWRDVWAGALFAAVAFQIATSIFVNYVSRVTDYNLIYGPLGAVIALLVWVFISAEILLLGAKLASIYPKMRQLKAATSGVSRVRQAMGAAEASNEDNQTTPPMSPLTSLFGLAMVTGAGLNIIKKIITKKG